MKRSEYGATVDERERASRANDAACKSLVRHWDLDAGVVRVGFSWNLGKHGGPLQIDVSLSGPLGAEDAEFIAKAAHIVERWNAGEADSTEIPESCNRCKQEEQ